MAMVPLGGCGGDVTTMPPAADLAMPATIDMGTTTTADMTTPPTVDMSMPPGPDMAAPAACTLDTSKFDNCTLAP